MSLVLAFKRNAEAVKEAEATYKGSVITLNTLITNIFASTIPPLNTPLSDWSDFVATFTRAKAAALGWANDVLSPLLDIPQTIASGNAIVAALIAAAAANARTLEADPTNAQALSELQFNLKTLTTQINLVNVFVTQTIASIQTFDNSIPALAATLQQIATKASEDAKADQDQVDALNQKVLLLQADISRLTAEMVALATKVGLGLTLGFVGFIAMGPLGAATWFVFGPIVAVSSVDIALDQIQLERDQSDIATLQSQMTTLTADVSTLQILSTSFAAFAKEAIAIETNLTAILEAWQALETDAAAAVADITKATADIKTANFEAVAADLAKASADWQASYGLATGLSITLDVNTAILGVGMTSAEVSSALAAGTVMDVMDYYNSAA